MSDDKIDTTSLLSNFKLRKRHELTSIGVTICKKRTKHKLNQIGYT